MFLVSSSSLAQVLIQNPQRLEISEQRAQLLHNIVCRVVAEEFHVHENKVQGQVTVVLGEPAEHSAADEIDGVYKIYLEHWDEANFAISDMRLAVQRMVFRHHWERMAREVIRRVDLTTPVSTIGLHAANGSTVRSNSATRDKSLSAIRDSTVGHTPCDATAAEDRPKPPL